MISLGCGVVPFIGNCYSKYEEKIVMNIGLWIVQALVALAFIAAGAIKSSQPVDKLKKNMGWVEDVNPGFVKMIGILEILGGLGVILPAVTHILPWLTLVAAIGLVIIMVGAVVVHLRRNEASHIAAPLVLLLLSLIVVYGRFMLVPLT
jgi:uncharacterized membrane protein YphA (DoxX/SURF4 family)